MRHLIGALAMLSLACLAGCGVDRPWMPEGGGTFVIAIADTSGLFPGSVPGQPFYLDSTEVKLECRTSFFTETQMTDESGVAAFGHLVSGEYSGFAKREVYLGSAKKVFTGQFLLKIRGTQTASDTLIVGLIRSSELMINEIFFAGSCASSFYFYDQYVELYNASNDTMYLDGIILTRQMQEKVILPDTLPYVRATYAYQFPGTPVTGREHPIYPKQFLVIAADAVNHKQFCANSPDLSQVPAGAQLWETFNALGNDYDAPWAQNLNNIIPTVHVDYLINLTHNAAVIATGEEYSFDAEGKMLIPIATIIDGVEWNSNITYGKELTPRVDAGFAGIGVLRYSGMSTERRELGLDTNDSTFDFLTIMHPTPGYFH
jgi:hypothetical protein